MTSPSRGAHWRVYVGIAAVLCVAGIALIAVSWAGSRSGPPMPAAGAAGTIDAASQTTAGQLPADHEPSPSSEVSAAPLTPTGDPASTTTADGGSSPASHAAKTKSSAVDTIVSGTAGSSHITGPVLPSSAPVSLSIPGLQVSSALVRLGLNADGSIQVPDLNDPDSKAGWYEDSPTPGSAGPSVILGHIDSRKYGPGVFYRLGDLKPGDTIDVTRADGTVAVFRVDGVRVYPKDQFPTLTVYGNIDHAGLRLITCGGTFDPNKHSYESNIVAYATLISSHPTK